MLKRLINAILGSDPVAERRAAGYGMGMTIDELLDESNDFNSANGVFGLIDQSSDGWFDATKFTSIERPIMLVWHSKGIIGNGGFEYLCTLANEPSLLG